MISEVVALSSFIGLLGLGLWKVLTFTTANFSDLKKKANVWIPMVSLIGVFFFWGIYMVAYFSSFENVTTITGTSDTFTITENNYYFLTYLLPIVNALTWIVSALCVLEFVWMIAYRTYSTAKGSNV